MHHGDIPQHTKQGRGIVWILSSIVLSSLIALYAWSDNPELITSLGPVEAFFVIMFLMCGATVIAPITVLPLVPVVAPIVGPFVTGCACAVGWTLGAVAAFLIARQGGRPLLERVVDMRALSAYESRIPDTAHFGLIVAFRLVIPVDLLSYALGLFSSVSLRTYASASGIGIIWFSFAFAYLGEALYTNDAVLFIVYGVLSAIIFVGALWYVRRVIRAKKPYPEHD
jgi:uncharacterized membrane protein YdjX (TVP38/TMEM64 family)